MRELIKGLRFVLRIGERRPLRLSGPSVHSDDDRGDARGERSLAQPVSHSGVLAETDRQIVSVCSLGFAREAHQRAYRRREPRSVKVRAPSQDTRMTETETKWSERVRGWRASGKSAEEYAEGRGFKGCTLRYWASNLRRVAPATAEALPGPARVPMLRVVRRATSIPATIEVAVGGARVVVREGFDGALLRQVIAALGGES